MNTPSIFHGAVRVVALATGVLVAMLSKGRADIAGLVAEFRFDEETRNYADSRRSLSAASIQFASDRFDVSAHALASPESGFVGSMSTDFLKNRRQWTWSAWFRAEHPERPDQIVYSEDAQGNIAAIGVSEGKVVVDTYNTEVPGGWSRAIASGTVKAGTWYHLAITFDGPSGNVGECRVYVNGEVEFIGGLPMVKPPDLTAGTHAFALGRNIGSVTSAQPVQEFAGAIDDVLIFERALTPAEIPGLLVPSERLATFTAVELEFFARTGVSYQLQGSTDLAEWTNEGPVVTGENKPVVRFVSTRSNASRYWRLQPVN